MKIVVGAVIQNRNITENTEDNFSAKYKGKLIEITTDHGFGDPMYKHLKRFSIDVIDIDSGWKDVESYEDLHTMHDAIRSALKGACLIS